MEGHLGMGLDEFYSFIWNQLKYLAEIVIVDSKGTSLQ